MAQVCDNEVKAEVNTEDGRKTPTVKMARRRKSKKNMQKASGSRHAFGEEAIKSADGTIFTLSATHYLVDGTLGAGSTVMIGKRF